MRANTVSPSCNVLPPVNAIHSLTTQLASSRLNLSLPFHRTEKLQRSYKFQRVKIWNLVPQEIKILSFNQFKIRFKKHLHFLNSFSWGGGSRGQQFELEPPSISILQRMDALLECQGETNYDLLRNLAIEFWDGL